MEMNKYPSITRAVKNLEEEMYEVRNIDNLYEVIERFFETAFMQNHISKTFKVRGVEILLARDVDRSMIVITYISDSNPFYTIKMQAPEVIDMTWDAWTAQTIVELARENEETEYIGEVIYTLSQSMRKWFSISDC